MKAVVNAALVIGDAVLLGHSLVFDDKIRGICGPTAELPSAVSQVFDAEACFVSPGFIDIHVHGFAGAYTESDDLSGVIRMARKLPATGVTSFLPTTMSHTIPHLTQILVHIRHAMGERAGAVVLGCHLEGPFISEQARGAHELRFIAPASFAPLAGFTDVLKIVTVAPEVQGGAEFVAQCLQAGVKVAIGHTTATYEQAMATVESGASLFTHVFNAMPPLHHRQPGALGAALDGDAYCELIVDNIHVHPALQRLLLHAKGAEKIILVTDSTMAGLPDGTYELHGQSLTVKDNAVRLPSGQLAGSALTLDRAVRNFATNTGLSLPQAVQLVTVNPARLLGLLPCKGRLAVGMDADITIFDAQINIHRTFVAGECVYRS